jgi:NADH-quinone oxidoreductase subunit E
MNDIQLSGEKEQLFNDDVRLQIDAWLKKYPAEQRQSALIPSLHIVQQANDGWLSEDIMKTLADYLELPAISVFEVATFYSMFDLKPVGKNKVNVCTNISCQLNGSSGIVKHLEQRLGIGLGETTEDGKITLKEVECLGACCGAPMMQVNQDYHEHLSPDLVDEILDGIE